MDWLKNPENAVNATPKTIIRRINADEARKETDERPNHSCDGQRLVVLMQ